MSLLERASKFRSRKDDEKYLDLFKFMQGTYHYYLWCIRYPRLLAHRCFIGRGVDLSISRKVTLQFGRDVYFRKNFCGEFYGGKVILGDNVRFHVNCRVTVQSGLTMGDNAGCAEGVSIHDSIHPVTGGDDVFSLRPMPTKPIVIGKNVWIGAKATILYGVTIGDNAVIGAHAVVTTDIPANAVAVGVPARVVRIVEPQNAVVEPEVSLAKH